jgi:prevent-host-death family protein
VATWTASSTDSYPCPACDGVGVLWPNREPNVAASPPEGAETGAPFQHRGWPPTRATSLAVSAFTGNTKLILTRVRNGESIELTQRGSPVAVLVSRGEYARLTAQASALAALRARVETLDAAIGAFLTKYPAQIGSKSNREDYGSFVTTADLWALHTARAALSPTEEPTDG